MKGIKSHFVRESSPFQSNSAALKYFYIYTGHTAAGSGSKGRSCKVQIHFWSLKYA